MAKVRSVEASEDQDGGSEEEEEEEDGKEMLVVWGCGGGGGRRGGADPSDRKVIWVNSPDILSNGPHQGGEGKGERKKRREGGR